MSKDRVGVLDGLKGIAAIGIFGIHVGVNHGYFTGRLNDIFLYGNRGVEICYIVNAILLASSYYKHHTKEKYPFKLLRKNLLNIIPIFYLYIFLYWIVEMFLYNEYITKGSIISTILFVNVIKSSWSSCFGGSLFFSCLVITWILYFIYMRYVNNLSKSVICGLLIEVFYFRYIHYIVQFVPVSEHTNFYYFCRCITSFVCGHMVYSIVVSETYTKIIISKNVRRILTYLCVYILSERIVVGTLSMEELYFIIGVIIILNYKSSCVIIDNPVLGYLGKRIFPIFAWHILSYVVINKVAEFISLPIGNIWFASVAISTLVLSEITYQLDRKRRNMIKVRSVKV